ncbi:FAD-binding protein [Candidatus Dojkabacteria bacterium]|nr:FAD-binding protein [Candidatus Dojkabacteria bacterium]
MDITKLISSLDSEKAKIDEPLAPYTTLKVGGSADIFYTADSTEDLIKTVKLAKEYNIPVTLLGWGSNVLISDRGIRGIVIKVKSDGIKILNVSNKENVNNSNESDRVKFKNETDANKSRTKPRLVQVEKEKYYDFSAVDYDESDSPVVQVEIDAGVPIQLAINTLINKGITGLQWFSGIPGTIGGAIVNNIHGGAHFLEEYIDSVKILNEKLEEKTLEKERMRFDYDYSRFHKTKEIVLSAIFNLHEGDAQKAKATSIDWAKRKRLQPARSAGCVWKNIDNKTQEKFGFESNGFGYIIDKKLGLKGKRRGGAKISDAHAAFIETNDSATAEDVLELMKLIYKKSKEKFGIKAEPEIFLLGFKKEEINEFI